MSDVPAGIDKSNRLHSNGLEQSNEPLLQKHETTATFKRQIQNTNMFPHLKPIAYSPLKPQPRPRPKNKITLADINKAAATHDIDHILTNKKLAPLHDAYKDEHERFLNSNFNSSSKTNLEIKIDAKHKLELSQIDNRKQLLIKWDKFKVLKDKAIVKYCQYKRIQKRATAMV